MPTNPLIESIARARQRRGWSTTPVEVAQATPAPEADIDEESKPDLEAMRMLSPKMIFASLVPRD
jgi:hypothetical protein